MNRSRLVLMTSLALTLALSGWLALQPEAEDNPVAAMPPRDRPASTLPAPDPRPVPPSAPRSAWPEPAAQALAAWSGPPMPAAPAASAHPPRPAAPPFPYKWIGRLDDGLVAQALLSGPLRSFGVRVGEVLDGRWRVERIATSRLELTWLPTGDAVAVELR